MEQYVSASSSIDAMYDRLIDIGVSEQTLDIITCINGYSEKTMTDVLCAFSGRRNFDQLDEA